MFSKMPRRWSRKRTSKISFPKSLWEMIRKALLKQRMRTKGPDRTLKSARMAMRKSLSKMSRKNKMIIILMQAGLKLKRIAIKLALQIRTLRKTRRAQENQRNRTLLPQKIIFTLTLNRRQMLVHETMKLNFRTAMRKKDKHAGRK